MKEIGGYFELDDFYGVEYHNDAIALNSGRHCLEYLIRAKKIEKIYFPYYICSSVTNICKKTGCRYDYYNIGDAFEVKFDGQLNDNEFLYIINYYGQLSTELLAHYKEYYKNIIVDNAQAFFDMPIDGVDTLYTCRKFFGVADGGYLYTDAVLNEQLKLDKSYQRIGFVLGRYEENAEKFYADAVQNNKGFIDSELKYMSRLTHNILRGVQYYRVKAQREENYRCLHSELSKINKLSLTVPNGAFMYPLYLDNGEKIKKHLIKNKIYVPTLWPDVHNVASADSLESLYARNIIPLPVDQRYSVEDMKTILKIIDEVKSI